MRVCLCGCRRAPVSLRGSRSFASHACRARYESAHAAARDSAREEREAADPDEVVAADWSAQFKAGRPSEDSVRARLGLDAPHPKWGGV